MSAEVDTVPNTVMSPHEWHLYRRTVLMPGVERERSSDLNAARPNIHVAITEYAIRELYARVQSLEARLQEKTRGK